jgi:hypothetical protein
LANHRSRRLASAVGVAAIAGIALASGVAGVSLTAVGGAGLTFAVASSDGPSTGTITYTTAEDLPNGYEPTVVIGDLVAGDDGPRLAGTRLQGQVEHIGDRAARLVVTLDPAGATPGRYTGTATVVGTTTVDAATVHLTVLVRDSNLPLAAIVILGGLLLGWIARWLSETAVPLHEQTRRYELLSGRLKDFESQFPARLKAHRGLIQNHLGHMEHAQAKAAIDLLSDKADALLAGAQVTQETSAKLGEVYRALTSQKPAHAARVQIELTRRLADEREGLWPDPGKREDDRAELGVAALLLDGLMRLRKGGDAVLATKIDAVLAQYAGGGDLKMANAAADALLSQPPDEQPSQVFRTRSVLTRSLERHARTSSRGVGGRMWDWVVRRASVLVSVIGMLAIGAAVLTIYLTDQTFGAGPGGVLLGYGVLLATAFAAVVSGITISQAISKVPKPFA